MGEPLEFYPRAAGIAISACLIVVWLGTLNTMIFTKEILEVTHDVGS